MKRFLKACAEHPVSVLMVYAGIILFGITSLTKINIELLPSINIPAASVITEYSSIPASEVEELVTIPLENALSSVKGVKNIYSVSREGISSITLRFNWGTDMDIAAVEIREKIDSAYPYLPHGIKKPVVFTEDISEEPVIALAVFPSDNSNELSDIGELVKTDLKTRLLQINGVSNIRIIGADEKEIKIDVDAYKLYASNLTMQNIVQTIQSSIYEYPAGTLQENDLEYLIKTTTGIKNINQIKDIPVFSQNRDATMCIEDIADVYMGIKERTSFFHMNGKNSIGILLYKTGDTGSMNAADNIMNELDNIRNIFKNDLVITLINDASVEIRVSIFNLIISITLGIFAAFAVLVFFFRRAFIPVITIISIPVSICTVFLFMFFMNISLNIISLSGIAIGIGMIVDNSIVVLENLTDHLAESPEEIALRTAEMGSSTFGSTITTLLVFLPILFIPGITGALFSQLALTISSLLAFSFIISMTLTPALYKLFIKNKRITVKKKEPGFIIAMENLYRKFLLFSLRKPLLVFTLFILIFSCGIYIYSILPREIMPVTDNGKLEIEIIYSKGKNIDNISPSVSEIEKILLSMPGIINVYSEAGYDRNSLKDRVLKNRSVNIARLSLQFDNSLDINNVKEKITETFKNSYDFNFKVSIPENIINKILGSRNNISILVTGTDRNTILSKSENIIEELKPYILEADSDTKMDTPQIKLELMRNALAYSSINISGILETLQSAYRGTVAAKMKTDNDEIDIRVMYKEQYTNSQEKLRQIKIPAEAGFIELNELGTLKNEQTYGELFRQDRKNVSEITLTTTSGNQKPLLNEINSINDPDISVASSSTLENNFKEIGIVFILAVILMYFVLGAQFESFKIPLLLLLSLPVSAAGSFTLLLITGKSLNINSFFGILILLGTTINTSIILCSGYKDGTLITVIRASIRRIKPIFATVLTTILALMPVAFNPYKEGALQTHMAMAVIGGLITGTIASILFFPVIYVSANRVNKKNTKPENNAI